ncbi:MAG: DUF2520 domain-containing protein [Blastocatellia bacterium]|nr:DUF2520 domain-containing protein [Blastocatellia bacterium]
MSKKRAAIIGMGRLGSSLYLLLEQLGYQVETEIDHLSTLPDIIFITTPDDAISEVATKLAQELSIVFKARRETVVLHCSGAMSSKELAPLSILGFATGSLHPLKSFTRAISSTSELEGVYWCFEGHLIAEKLAEQLVKKSRGRFVKVDSQMKPVYHAAAVMACGHLVALLDLSISMMVECGIERGQAIDMLLPLVVGTIENVKGRKESELFSQVLTGPFARGDFGTVQQHIKALMNLQKDYISIYSLLGHHSLQIAKKRD